MLVDEVVYLEPGPAVFEARLEGWARQQRTRGPAADTVRGPPGRVRSGVWPEGKMSSPRRFGGLIWEHGDDGEADRREPFPSVDRTTWVGSWWTGGTQPSARDRIARRSGSDG